MDPKEINEKLTYFIRPLTFPVAVKLLGPGEELPEKAKVPTRDFGHKILACQAMAMARRHGQSVAIGAKDDSCAPSAVGLGLVNRDEVQPPPGFEREGGKALAFGKYPYFLYAPLHSVTFEPDILVIYGNSAQIMRLVQAYSLGGKEVNTVATALVDCVDIAYVKEAPGPYVILPSGGDRVFGTTQDFEMIFALPWSMVEECIGGLEVSHKMGFRYPVVSYLRYEAKLPPFLDLEQWKKK
jgi:uncharacterized protein (DUF169 family)